MREIAKFLECRNIIDKAKLDIKLESEEELTEMPLKIMRGDKTIFEARNMKEIEIFIGGYYNAVFAKILDYTSDK